MVKSPATLVPVPEILQRIHVVRGKRVMLDADLARFYGVGTRELNKAVTRNLGLFPGDFSCILTAEEFENLMFQSGTSSSRRQMVSGLGKSRLPELKDRAD